MTCAIDRFPMAHAMAQIQVCAIAIGLREKSTTAHAPLSKFQ
jgi:hypothetical protein